jgi:hypothetical protein
MEAANPPDISPRLTWRPHFPAISMKNSQLSSRTLIDFILVGLVIFGIILAIGSIQYGGRMSAVRALIIFTFVSLFAGMWMLLLRLRGDGDGEKP